MPSCPAARQTWLAVASSGVCVILPPPPGDVCKRSSEPCAQLCITFMLQADYLKRTQHKRHSKLCLAGVYEWACQSLNLVTGNAQHCAHYITAAGEVTTYPSQFTAAYFLAANNKDCLRYQSCFHLFSFFFSWFSKRATLIYWPNI